MYEQIFTIAEQKILKLLEYNEYTGSEVCKYTGLSPPYTYHILKQLMKKGLLTRRRDTHKASAYKWKLASNEAKDHKDIFQELGQMIKGDDK